jgi:putative GTP pyrophosphokinase
MDFVLARSALQRYYEQNFAHLGSAKDAIVGVMGAIATNSPYPISAVTGRVKSLPSSVEKLSRKYARVVEELNDESRIPSLLTDLIGIRVVCCYGDHVRGVGEEICKHFDVHEETDRTVEADDAGLFGYRALHFDLRLNNARRELPEFIRFRDLQFELQIRSLVQDAWSTLDHRIKYKKNLPFSLARRVNRLAALAEMMDSEFSHIRDEGESMLATGAEVSSFEKLGPRLDVITFVNLLHSREEFGGIPPSRIDLLFDQIIRVCPTLTSKTVADVLADGAEYDLAKKYLGSTEERRSTLTVLRCALFLKDPAFGELLYPELRREMDKMRKKPD